MRFRPDATNLLVLTVGVFLGVMLDSTFLRAPAPGTPDAGPAREASPSDLPPADAAARRPGHNMVVSAPRRDEPQVELDPDRPVVEIDEPIYDFGSVETGLTVDHVFQIRNAGRSLLKITAVRPTCGCTLADISRREIPPGETATLQVQLSLKGLIGSQNKPILLQTNAPVDSAVRLALTGDAYSRVALDPVSVDFGQVPAGRTVERTVTVRGVRGLEFSVSGVTTSSPQIRADYQPVSRTEVRVKVTCDTARGSGYETGWVHLHTDHPGTYQSIPVPVTVYVTGAASTDFTKDP